MLFGYKCIFAELATRTSLQLEYRSVGCRFWLLWGRKCWDSLRQKRRRTGLFLRDAIFAECGGRP